MHHSERKLALYLLLPSGVTRIASSKDALTGDIVKVTGMRKGSRGSWC